MIRRIVAYLSQYLRYLEQHPDATSSKGDQP